MFPFVLARDLVICVIVVTLLTLALDRIQRREQRLSQIHSGALILPDRSADACRAVVAARCRAAFLSDEPRLVAPKLNLSGGR